MSRRPKSKKISFSPSAIQLFAGCERKSYLVSACGLKQAKTKNQEYGDLLHAQLEAYLKTGKKPTDTRALESLKNLPAPGGRGVRCEGDFTIPIDDWREVNGRLDVDFAVKADGRVRHVMDHKSSKDPDKYSKTEEELRGDIQVNMYAKKVLIDYPEASEVIVSHHVIATEGAHRSFVTSVDDPPLSRKEVENNFRKYLQVIDDMTEVWNLPTAFDADPTGRKTGECKKWGGCHLKQQCDTLIFRNLRKGSPMSTKEDLKAKLARLQAGTPPPKSSPAAAAEARKPAKRQPVEEEEETIAEVEEEEAPPPPKTTKPAPKPAAKPAPKPVEEAPPADDDKAGPILLINCVAEVGVESVPLEAFLAPYLEMIQEQTGKSWRIDDYGNGPAMLEMAIDSIEEFPEALTIDGGSYLGKNALPALLRRKPQAVIRGVVG